MKKKVTFELTFESVKVLEDLSKKVGITKNNIMTHTLLFADNDRKTFLNFILEKGLKNTDTNEVTAN